MEWAALAVTGALAILLWLILDEWWPWALALGVLLVAALIGVRRPAALAVGLAAADVWWLLSIPLWGWALTIGGIVLTLGLWWSWAHWKARFAPAPQSSALPAVRGVQPVPPESPTEITAPIPRVPAVAPAALQRLHRLPIPGLAGRPVARWQPVTALAVAVALLAVGILGWRLDVAAERDRRQADLNAAHDLAFARILPRSGADLVYAFARAIGERKPEVICFAFLPQAGRDFARAHGGDTCEAAIDNLSRRVQVGARYQNAVMVLPLPSNAITYVDSKRKIVDACSINVNPPDAGPSSLGIFTMDTVNGEGSQITNYTKCL